MFDLENIKKSKNSLEFETTESRSMSMGYKNSYGFFCNNKPKLVLK